MLKITLTKGPIASGKTTWAIQQVDQSNGGTVNINKDDLRAMLHNNKHSDGREDLIIKMQEAMIDVALAAGKHVILSDTNLNPTHFERIKNKFGSRAKIEINEDFMTVDINECIRRDSKRPNPVGEKAIRNSFNKWIRKDKPQNLIQQDENLPKCCLFDLDGTIFIKYPDRDYYEWDKVALDTPKSYVVNLLKIYKMSGFKIILLSGRKEKSRIGTVECLNKYNIPFDDLFMRLDCDDRSDDIVKREIFDNYINNKYYVEFVVDDRPKVLRLWFQIGLNVFSVNHPDNEF
jgi:predicted kinase